MIRHKTYQAFSKVTVFLLILLVTFASCGFSYAIHYCHGTRSNISVLPEILPSTESCECDISKCQGHASNSNGISKTSCCKNLYFYQKINLFSYDHLIKATYSPSPSSIPFFETGLFRIFSPSFSEILPAEDPSHIPLQGRSLIVFLHQIRIPAIPFDC